LSKVLGTSAPIASVAKTFLDNFYQGTYTTYGADTANIVAGNWIYDAPTTASGHKDLTGSTAYTVGATGTTAIFSNGNISLDSVVNSTVASDYVIILYW